MNERTINIIFTKIGFSKTEFTITSSTGELSNTFILKEKIIDDIVIAIQRWYLAYGFKGESWQSANYYASREILNSIKQRTLLSEKSVWDLFKEKYIEIQDLSILNRKKMDEGEENGN